jgi:hypothetical protein
VIADDGIPIFLGQGRLKIRRRFNPMAVDDHPLALEMEQQEFRVGLVILDQEQAN